MVSFTCLSVVQPTSLTISDIRLVSSRPAESEGRNSSGLLILDQVTGLEPPAPRESPAVDMDALALELAGYPASVSPLSTSIHIN